MLKKIPTAAAGSSDEAGKRAMRINRIIIFLILVPLLSLYFAEVFLR